MVVVVWRPARCARARAPARMCVGGGVAVGVPKVVRVCEPLWAAAPRTTPPFPLKGAFSAVVFVCVLCFFNRGPARDASLSRGAVG